MFKYFNFNNRPCLSAYKINSHKYIYRSAPPNKNTAYIKIKYLPRNCQKEKQQAMPDLNLNNTVTLGRNIIQFINDLRILFSSPHGDKAHYLKYLHDQLVLQNDNFKIIAADYFSLISKMRNAAKTAQSSNELLTLFQSFMDTRDKIVFPRSELLGSSHGVERLLATEAPVDLKIYLRYYKEYISSVEHFFYESTVQDGGSLFSDIFQKAYYAFTWKKDGETVVEDPNRLEETKIKLVEAIDEAKVCMEASGRRAAERYLYLQGRLASKL